MMSVPPYVRMSPDGSDPRVTFPVRTPTTLVFVESRAHGRFTVSTSDRSGVPMAIEAAKAYIRAHPKRAAELYGQLNAASSA